MRHLTMSELNALGFEVVESYTHDNFMTQRRKKGLITIETTWLLDGTFESQDMTIEDVNCIPFTKSELEAIDKLVNKTNTNENN